MAEHRRKDSLQYFYLGVWSNIFCFSQQEWLCCTSSLLAPTPSRSPSPLSLGGVAGAVESATCHPLDTVKTRTQLTSLGPMMTARGIVETEGFLAL